MLSLRSSTRLLFSFERAIASTQRASMTSMEGLKGYGEKEMAQEAVYFHKEDERLLKQLLAKVRASAEMHDKEGAATTKAVELKALNELVGNKLTDVEKEALIAWKHTHY